MPFSIVGTGSQIYAFGKGVARRRHVLGMSLADSIRAGMGSRFTILFLPRAPIHFHIIYKLCDLAAIRRSSDPSRPYDLVWRFLDDAVDDAGTVNHDVAPVATARKPINADCRDLRKGHVNRVFEHVFGYAVGVDPTTFSGPMVQKSEANAKHDGKVLEGPLRRDAVRPEKSYQRLIDNRAEHEMVLDLRVVICGDDIPLVYRKLRPVASRFSNVNASVSLADPSAEFSDAERALLLSFARAMGADCAELDVLRDNASGMIFVVDVNTTAFGPPNHLPPDEAVRAQRLMLPSFLRLLGADALPNS